MQRNQNKKKGIYISVKKTEIWVLAAVLRLIALCPMCLTSMVYVRKYTYDLILQTVEDKDEKSLQWVEDGEGISHAHRLLVQVQ